MEKGFVKIHKHTPFLWADSILLLQGENKDIMIELIEGSKNCLLDVSYLSSLDSALAKCLPGIILITFQMVTV